MAPTTHAPVLFPDLTGAPDGVVVINERCRLQTRDGYRIVTCGGLPLVHFSADDRAGEAHAMVMLVDLGWARQFEVARAFGCAVRTVRRHQRRFEDGGLGALGRPRGYPRGRSRVAQGRKDAVNQWKSEGVSNREIARRLGIDEKAVRKLARRLGWPLRSAEQMLLSFESADPNLSGCQEPQGGTTLAGTGSAPDSEDAGDRESADPNLSAPASEPDPVAFSLDRDPADRAGDRLLARLGLLDDATPLFGAGTQVPGVGVLLAIPALLDSGVLSVAREIYGGLGPAFYGLRTTLVTLLSRNPPESSLVNVHFYDPVP